MCVHKETSDEEEFAWEAGGSVLVGFGGVCVNLVVAGESYSAASRVIAIE